MSNPDDSGTAFPEIRPGGYGTAAGLTKREYFAAAALTGMLSDSNSAGIPEKFAELAVVYADALLKRLEEA